MNLNLVIILSIINISFGFVKTKELNRPKRQVNPNRNPNPITDQIIFINPSNYRSEYSGNENLHQHHQHLFHPHQIKEQQQPTYVSNENQEAIKFSNPNLRRVSDKDRLIKYAKKENQQANLYLPLEHREVENRPLRLIPEEHLLRLIEEELIARGFPFAPRNFHSQISPSQLQHGPIPLPQEPALNIANDIANKAKTALSTYQNEDVIPINNQQYALKAIKNVRKPNVIENIEASGIKYLRKPNENNQNPNVNPIPKPFPPQFIENYNTIPFAQLNSYSSTPQPAKANSENKLLKTAPQIFSNPINNPVRNNPYFTGQDDPRQRNINQNQIKLPINIKKPLSQEEFQALVDAGYPVQAVPVPIPYDEYIKQQQRYVEIPLKPKQQNGITAKANQPAPVHIQQQKQQLYNGAAVVAQNI